VPKIMETQSRIKTRPYKRRLPNTHPKQRPAQRHPHGIGKHELLDTGRIDTDVMGDDLNQPQGNGMIRRPAALFGYSLNAVCPLTSTTVRMTSNRLAPRSTASKQSPAASPQRKAAPAAVAMMSRYRSGADGSKPLEHIVTADHPIVSVALASTR
jgi:hypothetical protein